MTKSIYPLAAALLVTTLGCSNGWWRGTGERAVNTPAIPEPGVSPPSMGELRNGLKTPRPAAPEAAGQGAPAPAGQAP